ncbi:hypothetical protein Tco_1446260, partial [Tanacetum coccineum]
MQLIQKLHDDKRCMKKVEPSSRSKAIKDIISIGSFVEALVLNHYVLIKKILRITRTQTAIKHSAAKVGPRKSSTNSKEEKFLTKLQNLQTQEKEASYTGISKDTPEILAFRRDLDQLAQNHL